ncbi:hypothetical protein NQZ68_014160 [Dissostichus eleginoides]|nr:hypothetical protein NQZ68_014160 [Dissostichus eleginoides]
MVWDQLDRRVKEKQLTSAQHLWEVLQDCWKTIPGDDLMKLTFSSVELELMRCFTQSVLVPLGLDADSWPFRG